MIKKALENSISYEEYRKLIADLREENRTTSDSNSEAMLNYTDLNVARMNKWDKRFEISDQTKALVGEMSCKEIWLVLTEGWCGDAAHALPVMEKIASEAKGKIDFRLVLREQNLELMDQYLTNGGRSIPKLIRLEANTLEELGTWGPRPEEAQNLFNSLRDQEVERGELNRQLQLWYARNSGEAIEKELVELIECNPVTV